MKFFYSVVMLCVAAVTAGAQSQTDVDCASAWKKIVAGAVLIDVRTKGEFDAGHIEQAQNIPYDEIDSRIKQIAPDTSKEIVVYCRSGRRSGIAKKTLEKLGYRSIVNAGGFAELKNCGR